MAYDSEQMTEHEAQEAVLQNFPERIHGVEIYFVERTEGGVNADGIATQPKATTTAQRTKVTQQT